jgi:hypothetical protein
MSSDDASHCFKGQTAETAVKDSQGSNREPGIPLLFLSNARIRAVSNIC